MDRTEFDDFILTVLDGIPEQFKEKVENLSLEVDETAIPRSPDNKKGMITLALYHGVPLTRRGANHPVFPDKITIYKKALESVSSNDDNLRKNLKRVLLHELGHYFGLDEDKLNNLGY